MPETNPRKVPPDNTANLRSTGIKGLDTVFRGGLRPAAIVIIEGHPGTGKTILASELAYRAATELNEATSYFSFEMREDFFRDSFSSFGWTHAHDARIRFVKTTPEQFVTQMTDAASEMRQLFRNIDSTSTSRTSRMSRLVIDSLTPLKLYFEDKGAKAYREFLNSLFEVIRDAKLSAFIVTETQPLRRLGETACEHEHFLADTIITLRKDEQHRSLLRSMEAAKSRGQKTLTGRHAFRIEDASGIVVYPRAYARDLIRPPDGASTEQVRFGIAGLEEMFGGGVFRGSSTLIIGVSGTGKTIASMQFLMEGLRNGESCLFATLDVSEAAFARNALQIGFDFRPYLKSGALSYVYELPLEIELDVHFSKISEALAQRPITRAVIDSLSTYEFLLPLDGRDFMIALAALLRDSRTTSVFCYECEELLGISEIGGGLNAASLSDNIVLMNYVEISTTLRRALTVPKTRAGSAEPANASAASGQQTREYVIKMGGLTLLDDSSVPSTDRVPQLPLSSYYSVLARSPTRHSPMIDESVAAGKPMPKSKIPRPIRKGGDATGNAKPVDPN